MADKITTPGAIRLKHSLPTQAARDSFDLYKPLDKDGVKAVVTSLLRDGGPQAAEHINNLGKTFFNQATEIGASTPLSDYINNSDEREALIREFDTKVQLIMASKGSKAEKNERLTNLTSEYNTKIETQNLKYLLGRKSMAARMASSGARGNPMQLASGTSTPLMSLNVKGELVPIVIEHSFAEGMRPAEQIALSYMGRGSTVMAQLSTALPGALFKRLAPTVFHEIVTVDDCGTHNGIPVAVGDAKSLIGRYLQGTRTLITEAVYKDLKMGGKKMINVRSTMTCEAHQGVCQHCFGLMANGKLPEIGTNVGVIAAQSVSEVLTQAMLSTKHKATVGERKGNTYEQASNLLNNPAENFKDKATLASMNGKVNAIKKTALGDSDVFIDGKPHFVPIAQKVLVNEGDEVRMGDPLSTGTINPRELVGLRGIGAGRDYMAKELRSIYKGDLDPRHFEIIARNLIKHVEVIDPGHTPFLPGEKVDINTVRKYLDDKASVLPIERAEGKVLAKGIYSVTPGTLLDANHIQDLKDLGVKHVSVSGSGLKVQPIVPGLQTSKMLDKNWVSKLSFSRLRDTLKEAAALKEESEIHSSDPITSYMFGNEFGEGPSGKY